uniref:Putative secreted protein n=1 Tax=Amblyomma cajennense TaxID=34607 RepID=A0A023FBM2_AMBCJ
MQKVYIAQWSLLLVHLCSLRAFSSSHSMCGRKRSTTLLLSSHTIFLLSRMLRFLSAKCQLEVRCVCVLFKVWCLVR